MAALAEIIVGEHEVFCRGGEIIGATPMCSGEPNVVSST